MKNTVILKTRQAESPVEKPSRAFLSGTAIGMTASSLSDQLIVLDKLLDACDDERLEPAKFLLHSAIGTALVLDGLCESAGLL